MKFYNLTYLFDNLILEFQPQLGNGGVTACRSRTFPVTLMLLCLRVGYWPGKEDVAARRHTLLEMTSFGLMKLRHLILRNVIHVFLIKRI